MTDSERHAGLAHISGPLIGLITVLALVLTACGSSALSDNASTTTAALADTSTTSTLLVDTSTTSMVAPTTSATTGPEPLPVSVERMQYRDSHHEGTNGQGSVVDVHVPVGSDGLATVVLLHGHSDVPGSPTTPLRRFAPEIARLGAVVFEFYWQTAGITADSKADLSCIGPFVKAHASAFGGDSDNVVVVGHSIAGATGSLLALSSFGLIPANDCTETGPSPQPTGFLGLGGAYGVIATPLDDDATTFEVHLHPADPIEAAADEEVSPGLTAMDAYGLDGYSALPTDNPVSMVLLVGELDPWPMTNADRSIAFGHALEEHGIDVEVMVVPQAGHTDVVAATTAGGKSALAVIENLIQSIH